MPIEAGRSLLHYRLTEKIGAGGMGVVWKAADTALGREVAIKILPEAFATSPERLARFEREARLLATLNHPAGWLMSAPVRLSETEIVAGVLETVLDLSTVTNDFVRNTFDLTPDGKGLVAIQPIEQGHRTIRVRSGWRPTG